MFSRSTNGTPLSSPRAPRTHPHKLVLISTLALLSGSATGAPIAWKNSDSPQLQAAQVQRVPVQQALKEAKTKRTELNHAGYLIVTLDTTPNQDTREQLQSNGLELLDAVGHSSYFARLDPNANTNEIAQKLSSASNITRAHKLHPAIESDNMPEWAIVGSTTLCAVDGSMADPTVAAYVMMHRDVDASSDEISSMIKAAKGSVRSIVMSMNTVVVEMPYSQLKKLADDDRVQWIEPPLPPLETSNFSNRVITQVNTANSAPYNLDGTGVTVLVYDGGNIRTTHNDFSGRATNIDSAGVHYHPTHVAGTIGGDGSTNANHRGMAPGVNLLGAGFEVVGGLSQGFLYTDPGDLEADYTLAMSLGATISNNSIGANVAQNGYPCAWHGDYGITAGTIDNVIRGSLGEPITVFWAAGNERGNGRCGVSYGTTAPPSNNKNSISIGALNSNDDSMTSFSSWGPSDDGRIRPVVSAPGCQSGSDGGVTSTGDGSNTEYITLCGTSMATPTAAGIGALIVQDFREQFPSWGDPSNQLMKVILIEGAEDILNPGPDYQSGYGSIRAVDSIDFLRTGNFREDTIGQEAASTYSIEVSEDDPEFRVTIAWDDPAGAPNVSLALVNDLDLVVTDPSGNRHYPWTLNPFSPSAGAIRTQEDHINNIEQVYVQNPQPGIWQVQVIGTAITEGSQSFALASSLDIGDGLLSILLTEDAPELILPGTPITVTAEIKEGIDTLVPGSVELNYRYAAGSYTSIPMSDNEDGTYSATIPGASCGDTIEYYTSANGSIAGPKYSPPSGPSAPTRTEVGEIKVALTDTFETNNGWTVSGDALDGAWTRGVPVDCASRGAPDSDSDGSGQCWITDNDASNSCNSDVDNGTTILTSPIYDIAAGGEFSFDYWYSDIPTGEVNGDQWAVEGSFNGGATWIPLRSSTIVSSNWRSDTIQVGTEIAATDQMRFRFMVDDIDTQNVIEAGLDNIRISRFICEDIALCTPDMNNDDVLDFFDISAFLSAFGSGNPDADFNSDGQLDFFDVSAFIAAFNAGCP
ncbi:MAG: S8 family serine peptidase [Phycisphaerales bacterium]|nr:S8 family serine peptidase [Phycisphaerales bacterium]